jgi:hypothetical protein
MVRNTETTILGYGDLKVMLTKSLDGTAFPLKQVAYCPGFYVNLISAERAANAGIYLNGRDCLLEEKDGTPICRLDTKTGIYLIRWDESTDTSYPTTNHVSYPSLSSYLPLTTVSQDYVTPLTNQISKITLILYAKKQLEGTIDQWHRRLGYVGKDVLSRLPDYASSIAIKDISSPISYCETYKLANSPRQISRLPM